MMSRTRRLQVLSDAKAREAYDRKRRFGSWADAETAGFRTGRGAYQVRRGHRYGVNIGTCRLRTARGGWRGVFTDGGRARKWLCLGRATSHHVGCPGLLAAAAEAAGRGFLRAGGFFQGFGAGAVVEAEEAWVETCRADHMGGVGGEGSFAPAVRRLQRNCGYMMGCWMPAWWCCPGAAQM